MQTPPNDPSFTTSSAPLEANPSDSGLIAVENQMVQDLPQLCFSEPKLPLGPCPQSRYHEIFAKNAQSASLKSALQLETAQAAAKKPWILTPIARPIRLRTLLNLSERHPPDDEVVNDGIDDPDAVPPEKWILLYRDLVAQSEIEEDRIVAFGLPRRSPKVEELPRGFPGYFISRAWNLPLDYQIPPHVLNFLRFQRQFIDEFHLMQVQTPTQHTTKPHCLLSRKSVQLKRRQTLNIKLAEPNMDTQKKEPGNDAIKNEFVGEPLNQPLLGELLAKLEEVIAEKTIAGNDDKKKENHFGMSIKKTKPPMKRTTANESLPEGRAESKKSFLKSPFELDSETPVTKTPPVDAEDQTKIAGNTIPRVAALNPRAESYNRAMVLYSPPGEPHDKALPIKNRPVMDPKAPEFKQGTVSRSIIQSIILKPETKEFTPFPAFRTVEGRKYTLLEIYPRFPVRHETTFRDYAAPARVGAKQAKKKARNRRLNQALPVPVASLNPGAAVYQPSSGVVGPVTSRIRPVILVTEPDSESHGIPVGQLPTPPSLAQSQLRGSSNEFTPSHEKPRTELSRDTPNAIFPMMRTADEQNITRTRQPSVEDEDTEFKSHEAATANDLTTNAFTANDNKDPPVSLGSSSSDYVSPSAHAPLYSQEKPAAEVKGDEDPKAHGKARRKAALAALGTILSHPKRGQRSVPGTGAATAFTNIQRIHQRMTGGVPEDNGTGELRAEAKEFLPVGIRKGDA